MSPSLTPRWQQPGVTGAAASGTCSRRSRRTAPTGAWWPGCRRRGTRAAPGSSSAWPAPTPLGSTWTAVACGSTSRPGGPWTARCCHCSGPPHCPPSWIHPASIHPISIHPASTFQPPLVHLAPSRVHPPTTLHPSWIPCASTRLHPPSICVHPASTHPTSIHPVSILLLSSVILGPPSIHLVSILRPSCVHPALPSIWCPSCIYLLHPHPASTHPTTVCTHLRPSCTHLGGGVPVGQPPPARVPLPNTTSLAGAGVPSADGGPDVHRGRLLPGTGTAPTGTPRGARTSTGHGPTLGHPCAPRQVEYRIIVQVLNENDNRPHFQGATVLTHNVSEVPGWGPGWRQG